MWYCVYDLASNVLLSVGDSLGQGLPDATRGVLERADRPDLLTEAWSESTATWGAKPVTGNNAMSKGDWISRIGIERRMALDIVLADMTQPPQLRGPIQTLKDMLNERGSVAPSSDLAKFGASKLADILLTIGQLPEGKQAFCDMMAAPSFA